jgi:hypothetical protein
MHSLCILDEHRIDLDETCRLLGTSDTPAHLTTALRAMNVGRKKPGGGIAYLEHLHVGGKIITSREAVERYLAQLNGIALDGPNSAAEIPSLSKRRKKHLEWVDAELSKIGIGG